MNFNNIREIPEAIQWFEGMLLAPQHFQQLGLRGERLLNYHMHRVSPFHWGVVHHVYDPLLLYGGTYRITELEAVLPDGLAVSHPYAGSNALELDLKPYLEQMKEAPLRVHLVVPAWKSGSSMVRGDLVRYDSVEGMPVADENTGEDELDIPRLKPRLALVVGETPPSKYVSFPIAEIEHRNDSFQMTSYIPSQLNVTAASPLGALCSQVAKLMREKAVSIAEKLRSPSVAASSHFASENKNIIQALTEGLPFFEGILNSGASHPYQLYLGMLMIAGHLGSISSGMVPPVFRSYNHNELSAIFGQLQEYINRVVREGVLESHVLKYFDLEEGVFTLNFEKEWMDAAVSIGVRGKAGMTERDVVQWMESAIVGSRSRVDSLRERRILGVERKKIDRDENLLPPMGVVLFSLKVDPIHIETGEPLDIVNTADPRGDYRPGEIVMYIRKN